jgi:hypothetical protein
MKIRVSRFAPWLLASCLFAGPARAQLDPGCDCWITELGTQIELPPLPSGFFGSKNGTPSDATPQQLIGVRGNPLPTATIMNLCPNAITYTTTWLDRHGTPVAPNDKHAVSQQSQPAGVEPIDTIVCRTAAVCFTAIGNPETVPIELVELSLVSMNPITVTYGTQPSSSFDMHITESGPQAAGSMDLTPTQFGPTVQGNVLLNSLPIDFRVQFVDTAGFFPVFSLPTDNIDFTGNTGQFTASNAPPCGPVGVPTLTGWATLVFVGLLIAIGVLMIRRRAGQLGTA